ncbi:DgyrCDS1369 [Dimorphilus gyrociliatus]|nr:DgyrCDS1369 [Dimorphilus gyrociliatus]
MNVHILPFLKGNRFGKILLKMLYLFSTEQTRIFLKKCWNSSYICHMDDLPETPSFESVFLNVFSTNKRKFIYELYLCIRLNKTNESCTNSIKNLTTTWPKFVATPPDVPESLEKELMILTNEEKDGFLKKCWKFPSCDFDTVSHYLKLLFWVKNKDMNLIEKRTLAKNFYKLYLCSLRQNGKWLSWSNWSKCNIFNKSIRKRSCKQKNDCNICLGVDEEDRYCPGKGIKLRRKRSLNNYDGYLDLEESLKWAEETVYRYGSNTILNGICQLKGAFVCNDIELQRDIYQPFLRHSADVQMFWTGYVCFRTREGCPNLVNRIIWSGWTSWSRCSTGCGDGIRVRNRAGKCAPDMKILCDNNIESMKCTSRSCLNGGHWSEWNKWENCKGTCGESYRKSCKQHWQGGWSEWSQYMKECQAVCGSGITMRMRTCSRPLPNRNYTCSGQGSEIRPCTAKRCPNIFLDSTGVVKFNGLSILKFEPALDIPLKFPALVLSCRLLTLKGSGILNISGIVTKVKAQEIVPENVWLDISFTIFHSKMVLQVNGIDYVAPFEKYGLNTMQTLDFNQLMFIGRCPLFETCEGFNGSIAHLRIQQRELVLRPGSTTYHGYGKPMIIDGAKPPTIVESGNIKEISYPKLTGFHYFPLKFGTWRRSSPSIIKIDFESSDNVGDGIVLHSASSLYGFIVGLKNFQIKTCVYLVQDILMRRCIVNPTKINAYVNLALSIRITPKDTIVTVMINNRRSMVQKLLFPRPVIFGQTVYFGNTEPPIGGSVMLNAAKVLNDNKSFMINGFHGYIHSIILNSKTYSLYDGLLYSLDGKAKWLTGLGKAANVVYAPVFRDIETKMACDLSHIIKFDDTLSVIWVKDRTILKESTGDFTLGEDRDLGSYISYLQLTPRHEFSIYEGIYSCIIRNSNLGHDQIFKSFIITAQSSPDENILEAKANDESFPYTYITIFSTIGLATFSLFSCICCFLFAKYVESHQDDVVWLSNVRKIRILSMIVRCHLPNIFDHLDELEADEKITKVVENQPLLFNQMMEMRKEYGNYDGNEVEDEEWTENTIQYDRNASFGQQNKLNSRNSFLQSVKRLSTKDRPNIIDTIGPDELNIINNRASIVDSLKSALNPNKRVYGKEFPDLIDNFNETEDGSFGINYLNEQISLLPQARNSVLEESNRKITQINNFRSSLPKIQPELSISLPTKPMSPHFTGSQLLENDIASTLNSNTIEESAKSEISEYQNLIENSYSCTKACSQNCSLIDNDNKDYHVRSVISNPLEDLLENDTEKYKLQFPITPKKDNG